MIVLRSLLKARSIPARGRQATMNPHYNGNPHSRMAAPPPGVRGAWHPGAVGAPHMQPRVPYQQHQQRGYSQPPYAAAGGGGAGGGGGRAEGGQRGDQRGGWRDPLAAGATRRANEFVCELCQVITSSQSSLQSHFNGRSHKRAVKKAKAEAEGKPLGDTRQMRVETWDGTLLSDGTHDHEPQMVHYYDKSHNQGAMPPMHKYYSATMAKKRSANAEAPGAGAKRGASGPDDEPAAQRQKKGMDPVAPYRRRIGLANRDGNVDDGLAAFDELHAAGLSCETKTANSVLSVCAAAGAARWKDALRVYDEISERYSPDEGSYTCMIRLCGMTKQLDKGMEFFERMCSSGIAPKRRTYTPLLEACSEQPDGALQRALMLLADAKARDIELYEGDFAALVRSCTAAGADGVQPCQQIVLPEMMDLCYTLSTSTRNAVEQWATRVPERAAAGQTPAVAVPDSNGQLRGHRLQSLALTSAEAKLMLDQVSSLACADKKKTDHFVRFKAWVHRNGPFDVILDGANIGYSNQRVDKGDRLQWSQIDRVVEHYMREGLTHPIPPQPRVKPLIILHERHFYNERKLPWQDTQIIQRWRSAGILYTTPKQMNDDWFWLYASVLSTTANSSSIIISNDQMRDHHFQMLSMKHFLKWRERHWVNFEFFDRDYRTRPTFDFPTPYSIRMQPLDGHWFFPLNDQAEPGAQEGGRPEDGKHTGEWLVCEAVAGETTPEASRSADAAAAASIEQTARWKSALHGGDTGAGASAAGGASDGSESEQARPAKRPLEGAGERALAKLSKR